MWGDSIIYHFNTYTRWPCSVVIEEGVRVGPNEYGEMSFAMTRASTFLRNFEAFSVSRGDEYDWYSDGSVSDDFPHLANLKRAINDVKFFLLFLN